MHFYIRAIIAISAPLIFACKSPDSRSEARLSAAAPDVQSTSPQAANNAWLEIDLDAFEHNIKTLTTALGSNTKLCAVLKADGYGHGVDLLAPSLVKLTVPCVAIGSNDEAEALRRAGYRARVIRVRTPTIDEIGDGMKLAIEEPIGNLALGKAASDLAAKRAETLKIHVALNSGGMSRNGLETASESGREHALEVSSLPNLEIVGIMTHFAVEDRADVLKGLAAFKGESAWLIEAARLDRQKISLHCANSFATLEVPESRLDMVRVGGALFGDTVPTYTEYKRVMAFKSIVASVNSYPKGNTVSYDRTFTLTRDSRLANIPVGYSDGYRRSFSGKTSVLIRGKRFPVLGRVTMNTIMVDVTDDANVRPGDEVVLFGKQGPSEVTQAELEAAAGTILADLYTVWGEMNPKLPKRGAGLAPTVMP